MTNKRLRIFFLGSGIIAVPTLLALVQDNSVELVGVATQPDKKAGRGNKLTATPGGETAEKLGLQPWKIENINHVDCLNKLQQLEVDFILVIAFGQLLKETLLNLPKFGCINVHASILPRYRGASPINSAILAGETVSGISIMKMDKGLDTGPVYKILTVEIKDEDNTETLQNKLAELSASKTVSFLHEIATGKLLAVPQDHKLATHCTKINKNDAMIDWLADAKLVKNRIHAYFPWPQAYFFLASSKGEKRVAVIAAKALQDKTEKEPGTVLDGGKNRWLIACGNGTVLEILQVKPEGKSIMSGADFMRGSQIKPSDTLLTNSLTK